MTSTQSYTTDRLSTTSINKVLKNTYALLSMTLAFSAVCAAGAMALGMSPIMSLVLMLAAFGVLFIVNKTANSAAGVAWTFVFTGLMGASLGPTLAFYAGFPQGPAVILQALAGTAITTFGLSAYAITTRKDFSFMRGFLLTGLIVLIVAGIANLFLQMAALSLALSAAGVLLFSALILFDTSRIVNGGETNYIRATVALYLDIYNLFVHLLHLLMAFSGND